MESITVRVFSFFVVSAALTLADYWEDRATLMKIDQSRSIGSSIILNDKEQLANEILMGFKRKEFERGFANPDDFLAAQHFFRSKAGIEKSEVFGIIKQMPKGASLHSHDTGIASQEYVFNLTYRDNLYGCEKNGIFVLHFFADNKTTAECAWRLISSLRLSNSSFDTYLSSAMTLVVDNPETTYRDLNSVWEVFSDIFGTVEGLIGFKPVWQDYFYQVLKELYEDNVMYLEFRALLPEVYDLEGTIYGAVEVVQLYYDTLEEFKRDHPDFHGARLIYAPGRRVSNRTVDNYVEIFLQLKKLFPDFVAGFDLVGQEDLGYPLMQYLPQLTKLKANGAKFFFHAGETNWNGEPSDLNLFDAVLLNTTRIGHGYAILKHPVIQEIVKTQQIALEISPISNQVLKLVDDLRNHPGSVLISNNFPVVITCDDPSFWGAKGLSYDWYVAFMAMASRTDDLRLLKQLAINSINYSTMQKLEKEKAFRKWEDDWASFIDKIVTTQSPSVLWS